MIFSSDAFVFAFLPLWLALFWFCNKLLGRGVSWLIVAASMIFYAWWSVDNLPIIIISILINYAIVTALKKGFHPKFIVTLGVVFNICLLGWFKYLCFFETVVGIYGGCDSASQSDLPLAISFFTFQQIAYIVDIYKHREYGSGIPKLSDYAAFVSFFPHLIAGPITRSNELLSPIERRAYTISAETLEIGLFVFVVGFAKKVFIADPLGIVADPIFTSTASSMVDGLSALIGLVAFSLQIYFDFSGYSEMAVGLGLMIGIQLPWNFATPYGAASIADFWRRWHITLSNILRDYLYIPLGGNRHGTFRKCVNLLATMVLGGLWHGANWTFVAWGALHGVFLVIHALYGRIGLPRMPLWMGVILTNLAVVLAWTFFRADTFSGAWNILASLATPWSPEQAAGTLQDFYIHNLAIPGTPDNAVAAAIMFFALAYVGAGLVRTQDLSGWIKDVIARKSSVRIVVMIAAAWLLSYGLYQQSGVAQRFIYFDF